MAERDTTLTIKHPVTVKSRVTPALRDELTAELREALQQVEINLHQLEFQAKRLTNEMERKNIAGGSAWREKLEDEKARYQDQKKQLLERLQEVSQLPDGSEVVRGTVEALTQVRVGDAWQRLASCEVLLEEGIIVEIRRS
ncbi:MAG TPA: hypothetical protein GXZ96_02250 [Firmicutes bacterium]|jgi:hypothetical protein|nr:hypothetical protein [Bacillota bacterium]